MDSNQIKKYLLIPFDKKDELKVKYKIKWDVEKKMWYIEDDIPEELNIYTIKKIKLDYADKDILKKRFNSMRWEPIEKIWICSLEDYKIFIEKS